MAYHILAGSVLELFCLHLDFSGDWGFKEQPLQFTVAGSANCTQGNLVTALPSHKPGQSTVCAPFVLFFYK